MSTPLLIAVRTSSLRETHVYVRDGRGWILDALKGGWVPLVEAPGLGGRVLTAPEAASFLSAVGEP